MFLNFCVWDNKLYGSSGDTTGQLYQLDYGNDDDGSNIRFMIQTKYHDFKIPESDKNFQKIVVDHETGGSAGSYTIYYEIDNEDISGSFSIDLATYPTHYEGYFDSDAIGKRLRLRPDETSSNSFKINSILVTAIPQPVI